MQRSAQVLKKIPFFASLTEADRRHLASLLTRKRVRKGDILFRQGDAGTALYIILEGRIKISLSRGTDTMTAAILGQGEFLGEMALLDGLPRSADATALEDTRLSVLDRKDFISFLINNETTVRAILLSLSLRLRKADDLLAEMCFLNLSARLVRKLVELAELQAFSGKELRECSLNISQQDIGKIIGVSRESVNKELKTLRDKGFLSTSRNCIRIHDLQALKKAMT